MLTELSFRNFKAWRDVDIKFGSVTGLFGANSSGKSSLLQFLLMLKQTKNATDRGLVLDFGGPEQLVNLGTFRDVVRMHDEAQAISWKLNFSAPEKLRVTDVTGKRTSVLFEQEEVVTSTQVRLRNSILVCEFLAYHFAGIDFELKPRTEGSTKFALHPDIRDKKTFQFTRTPGRVWDLPGPVKTHLFPDQAKTYFQNADFLGDLENAYERQMDQIFYLGPLRDHPRREYQWAGARPEGVGLRGERVVDAILAATLRKETRNLGYKTKHKPFQEMIAYWLQEIGLIKEFRIVEIKGGSNLYQALVRRDEKSPEAMLTDVGFGVSQVLPALVLLYYVPEGSTVILEQPEIHLHPSVQSGLADAILAAATHRKIQVIVESHSEHLIRRLQLRVAEGSLSEEDTQLYFVSQSNGSAELEKLKLNLFGEIENWPPNFFGDELGEIAAIRSAGLKRRVAGSRAKK